jgi:hypothetical protein
MKKILELVPMKNLNRIVVLDDGWFGKRDNVPTPWGLDVGFGQVTEWFSWIG